MYRYKITFAYDGSNFSGFQIQPHKRTVEQVLKNAVNKIAKHPIPEIPVIGSGRTDAGVHALNQVAHFDIPYRLSNESMRKALNSILPLDILIKKAELVDNDFMPGIVRIIKLTVTEWIKENLLIPLSETIQHILNIHWI